MVSLILFILVVHFNNCFTADIMAKTADNYGPYVVEWEHYDGCRGPKMANLTAYNTSLIKTDEGMYRGSFNITILEPSRIDEIKMSVYTFKDNVKTLLWNYIVKKPCQHYALATFIETKLGFKNCVVKKGDYYNDINLTEMMINYLGNSFFYGDYIFKVVVISKKGNIVCFVFDPKFKKKTNKN